ncbi:hypothetical protein HPP92_023552 [Vanilla planifolia]|uniref:ribonuclease Z n=1 Tax=Vanilla planifolia TaxID=51239 RepID=A0A835UAZ1_VANPL|nr:hypothetical protein HPP92_023817 [Vanilla planifolia]KAG0455764.1 hypothetical protein HPP92_023552 [Vanilla planifolia]
MRRNVSSILINLFSKGLLLDCGEGTLAQLREGLFGFPWFQTHFNIQNDAKMCLWMSQVWREELDKAVKFEMHLDFSHHHHHTVWLEYWLSDASFKDVPHEPLLVVGPWPLKILDAYSRLEDLDMLFLDCRHTVEPFLDTNGASQVLKLF